MNTHTLLEPYLPQAEAVDAALSVYLHIPFCLTRCGYCSFFSLPYSQSVLAVYLDWLRREIKLWQGRNESLKRARTLYFGGGTPSLLNSRQINRLCETFDLTEDAEISLEINPIQITSNFLAELRETPINRLSIGLQSMYDTELAWLGRRHRAAQIPDMIKLCRDFGYGNLSLDLIYGLPGSDAESLAHNLERYLALEPEHISAYLLTPDSETPLGRKLDSGEEYPLPDEDNLAAQYERLCQGLAAAGFKQYEISNFCRPGFASRHNLAYWKNTPYLGCGASASGWLPLLRYTNPANLDEYYQNVVQGKFPAEAEECSAERAAADHLMMGLRLLEGVDLKELISLYRYDLLFAKKAEITELRDYGLLELEGSRLRLTPAALFISNAVIGELL